MSFYALSNADWEGYGVYERDRVGRDGLGQLPDLSALTQPECVNGLAHVPASGQALVKQALQTMIFKSTGSAEGEQGGVSGEASFMLGSSGGPWIEDLVAKGYVVMAEANPNVASGVVRIMASALPATVALFAGCSTPTYTIVDAHPAALAAAEAYLNLPPGTPPPTVPGGAEPDPTQQCPAGMVGVPPFCISATSPWPAPTPPVPGGQLPTPPPVPGGQAPGAPQPAPQKAGLPSWVLPVTIGVSLVAVTTAVLVARDRKPPRATPNRRRRRR